MTRGLLYEENCKPQFSGHETFPLRYGWLSKVCEAILTYSPAEGEDDNRAIFSSDAAIARFGVGKNMVSSMRHWSKATGIVDEQHLGSYSLTDLGTLLMGEKGADPWLENPASLWLLHWQLASEPSTTTTYYWVFNHFNDLSFDRAELVKGLLAVCDDLELQRVAATTIKRDVDCFLRAYVPKIGAGGNFTEDSIESPLAELGLIHAVNKRDGFQLKRGTKPNLSSSVFLYALTEFWQRHSSARTLSIESITHEPGSPGRVFLLDEDSVAERLYSIAHDSGGLFEWSETAGLRQVVSQKPIEEISSLEFLSAAYKKPRKSKAA